MKMRFVLGLVLALSGASASAEPATMAPEATISQGGKLVTYLILGGRQFRRENPGNLAAAPVGVPLGVTVKLRALEGRRIVPVESGLPALMLDPSVTLPAAVSGTNLALGVVRRNAADTALAVEAVLLLADDLTMFRARWEALKTRPADHAPAPEEYYDLGDWIDLAGRDSAVADQARLGEYESSARRAWQEALRLDEALLAPSAEAVAARAERYRQWLGRPDTMSSAARTTRQAACQEFLKQSAAPGTGEAKIRAQAAQACVTIGSLWQGLMRDQTAAERQWRSAAALVPGYGPAVAELRNLGYQERDGKWFSSEELRRQSVRDAANTTERLQAAEEARRRQLAGREREQLVVLSNTEEQRIRVDQALSGRTESDVAELLKSLNELDADVAREALFAIMSGQPAMRETAVAAALRSADSFLRMDAAALAAAYADEKTAGMLLRALAAESRADVAASMVRSLARLPSGMATGALIDAAGLSGVPEEARSAAIAELTRSTGQSFGADLAAWRAWFTQTHAKGAASSGEKSR